MQQARTARRRRGIRARDIRHAPRGAMTPMLNLSQRQTLQQKLTPQQVQYLQLLQLPVLALEQRIKAELEMNPLLEEAEETELVQEQEEPKAEETVEVAGNEQVKEAETSPEDGYTFEDFMNDDLDGR